ncbi:sodium channel protein para-like, partial [Copidosoma floridanum]
MNHRDFKLDDFIHNEDDTISNKSYGSHKNRSFKESHKGSIDSLDGEEKKDASKEDLEDELDDEDDEGDEDEEEEDEGEGGIPGGVIRTDEELDDYPADCCPDNCYKRFPFLAGDDDAPFWQSWANLRLKTFQLIENKYFETAVIIMILTSSLAL